MPRVKAAAVAKKTGGKKKNGYIMPEPVPLGDILTDLSKTQWKVGPSIGVGGFGEIYTASKVGAQNKNENNEYVIKIEPHGNGPLFVEMHFYMRNAKLEDINAFKQKKKLKSFGMPYLIGSGSHDLNGQKHRFIVLPRYGKDINSFFLANGKKLPTHTIYRLAIQMLDVYEYIHGCSYVHGDLKGANILLGLGKGGSSQSYLVDYGLASHYTSKDFKPDPKKMHNGTIEYTSRDAHNGVPTMRGDFEILGYNLLHWSGVQLPWERDNLLTNPVKVQKSKEEFMENVAESLNKLYQKNVPVPINQFISLIQSMEFNQEPNYEKSRSIFLAGLKTLGKTNTGDLDFKLKPTAKNTKDPLPDYQDDDSDDDSVFEARKAKGSPSVKIAKTIKSTSVKRNADKAATTPNKINKHSKTDCLVSAETPSKKNKLTNSDSPMSTPVNVSPVVKISRNVNSSAKKRYGKTIINDNLTPNPESKKTYELSLELDVSMDANVIVNVKRKKKVPTNDVETTPVTRTKIRKLNSDSSPLSNGKIHISTRANLKK